MTTSAATAARQGPTIRVPVRPVAGAPKPDVLVGHLLQLRREQLAFLERMPAITATSSPSATARKRWCCCTTPT